MKKLLSTGLLVVGAALATLPTVAQVSLYTFSQSIQPYTEISAADGGYVLGTPTFDPPLNNLRAFADPNDLEGTLTLGGYLGPAIGPGFPIGFNFLYNGEIFDRIGIAHGGWISFGRSADGAQAVNVFTSSHQGGRPLSHSYYATPIEPHKRNRIAGMGNSNLRQQEQSVLGGPVSEFRVATIGTAPNRVCVIQWKDFRYNYSFDEGLINFQIRLNESDNSVDVRFGEMNWPQTSGGYYQIGLGGRDNRDYNNRMTVEEEPSYLNDWNTTVQGADSASSCKLSYDSPFNEPTTATKPVEGLNFHWGVPVCPPPAWPVAVNEVGFDHALVEWTLPGTTNLFDYVIATTNDPNDPDAIATGSTQNNSYYVTGLQPLTYYYVFVRSVCGGVPGPWSVATRFLSQGGAALECDGTVLEETHCTSQHSTVTWYYTTSDGASPVRLSFQDGYVGSAGGEYLRIYDGADENAPLLFNASPGGSLAGHVITSTNGELTMKRYNEQGSCESQPWYSPWQWTVGCRNCTEALAAYAVVDTDCETQEYDVRVTVVGLGSSSSLVVNNTQGVAPTTITATGTYFVGPFAAGIPVTILLENPENPLCNVQSVPLVNPACPTVDCGPTVYEFCYDVGDQRQWLYRGDGEPIGIRFLNGEAHYYLTAATYQAADPTTVAADALTGALLNQLRTSQNPANELLVEMNVDAYAAWTCVNGEQEPWEYVVACYDGCVQPRATFERAPCTIGAEYHVAVTITELGSTGSVTIINDGNAPAVTATAAGTYQVGPFPSNSSVTIDVVGASELCTWTSTRLTYNCTGVGIAERSATPLSLYPNPTDGEFRVRYPATVSGPMDLRITDVAGRVVYSNDLKAVSGAELLLDLNHLPNGIYVVELAHSAERYTARVSIVH